MLKAQQTLQVLFPNLSPSLHARARQPNRQTVQPAKTPTDQHDTAVAALHDGTHNCQAVQAVHRHGRHREGAPPGGQERDAPGLKEAHTGKV